MNEQCKGEGIPRLLPVIAFMVCLAFSGMWAIVSADSTWIRLPDDQEIAEARDAYVRENTWIVQTQADCAQKCMALPSEFDQQMCLGRCHGPSSYSGTGGYSESRITDYYTIKLHNPDADNPVDGSEVFLVYTHYEKPQDKTAWEVSYRVARLSYQTDPVYSNTYHTYYFQDNTIPDCNVYYGTHSAEVRDAYINSIYSQCGYVKGFPGNPGSTPQLTVNVRTDYIGLSSPTGSDGVEVVFYVTEPGTPHDMPVGDAIIDFKVYEEGTGKLPKDWTPVSPYYARTGQNGNYNFRWFWKPEDRGKTWILEATASKKGYRDGTVFTSFSSTDTGEKTLEAEILDDNSEDWCYFTVRVTDSGTGMPVEGATVTLRDFYLYDAETDQWFNGRMRELGTYLTDHGGEYRWNWNWKEGHRGDMIRIDAYVSKEGYSNEVWTTTVVFGKDDIWYSPSDDYGMTARYGLFGKPPAATGNSSEAPLPAEGLPQSVAIPGGIYTFAALIVVVGAGGFLAGKSFSRPKKP